jgi:hypothetical protein
MSSSPLKVVVACAVIQEAGAINSWIKDFPAWRLVVPGMGPRRTREAAREILDSDKPDLLLTCGYAGALNPALQLGNILAQEDVHPLYQSLLRHGAKAGKFLCSPRVLVTAAEKQAAWKQTGLDAVEMESSIWRECCQAHFPVITLRVISDTANQDLPLDFNALMTADHQMRWGRLVWKIFTTPGSIGRLIAFQKETKRAAQELGSLLHRTANDCCR